MAPVDSTEYEPAVYDDNGSDKEPRLEVIDLTVKSLEEPVQNVRTVSSSLVDGFRPGSVDPVAAAASAVARTQQWTLADVFVESSEVTDSGYVEYTLRASLRGDSARATASEVIAAARAVSPEVSVVAESLHFVTKPGDELDALSSDSIRIRVKGGLTFEPSMLRWTFMATPVRSASEEPQSVEKTDAAEGSVEVTGPVNNPDNT